MRVLGAATPSRPSPARPAARSTLLALASSVVASGCDLPTAGPIVESIWFIQGEVTTIGVADYLPEGVTLSGDGAAFVVDVDPTTVVQTLEQLCDSCRDSRGSPVPKPAFEGRWDTSVSLPTDVSEAALTAGTVNLRTIHDFSFDPLRPGGAHTGTLTFTVRSESLIGPVLGAVSVEGSETPFSPGKPLDVVIDLDRADLATNLLVIAELDSPAGDPTPLDVASRLEVTAEARSLRVASAIVDISGADVSIDPVRLDVDDVDDTVVGEIEGGAFVLDITNDFTAAVDATIRIEGPGFTPITKPLAIPETRSSIARVEFTGEELRSFIGKAGVLMSGAGSVPATTRQVLLTPAMTLVIDVDAEIRVKLGG